jgi:aminoglycoside 3-N-acetyltransferase
MPTFTYKTMIVPEFGPPENAIVYGSGKDTNHMAEIFRPDMPADPLMGEIAEALRKHANVQRSSHPILSFAGLNARPVLESQTVKEPLLPFQKLADRQGWVLLVGVDHTANTAIHYGEHLAGRKQFTRWALSPKGVVICPGFPGCSDGFQSVSPHMEAVARRVELGEAAIQAVPLVSLVDTVCSLIKDEPTALLCAREDCPCCNTIRAAYTVL